MKHDLGGGLALFNPKRKEKYVGHLAFTARTVPYSMLVFFPSLSAASTASVKPLCLSVSKRAFTNLCLWNDAAFNQTR